MEITSDAIDTDQAKPASALGRFNDDASDGALFDQLPKRPAADRKLMFDDRDPRELWGDIFLLLDAGCFHT